MPIILKLIEVLEEFIERGKYDNFLSLMTQMLLVLSGHVTAEFRDKSMVIYNNLSEKIELMSYILGTIVVNITPPVLTIPPLLMTLANFYVFELDTESYEDILLE